MNSVDALLAEAARVVRPPPRLTVSEWADRYRRLSRESSAEPGQWRTSRAEYQRGIMDAVNDPDNRQIVVMSSAQVGKTEVLLNIIGYYSSQDPSPIYMLQPTLEMGEAVSKDRLATMIRDTPLLTDIFAEPNSKGSGNTLLHKSFIGGHVTIGGANSPASLASRPVRIGLFDELDRYPASAGTEGDPVSLAIKRTTTFWNRRIVMTSTPTVKGSSRIEQAFAKSDQRRYYVPCPHCELFQVLRWANVQPKDDPDHARIACEGCGALLDDAERIDMIAEGQWRATAAFDGVAGFHIWEAYSPWRSLGEIVEDYVRARPYRETLRVWINTSLGELWEDRDGDKIAGESLASTAEDYEQWTVPAGALLLTAGVDVQHDRLALTVWGYGPGEEAWLIGWDEIFGSPAEAATWGKLEDALARKYPHALGGALGIVAAAVDAGDGQTTAYVLDYCRTRRGRLAVKGQSQAGKPELGRPTKVEVNRRGGAAAGSALLWPVGVDTIKGWLMGRLKGEGQVHFPAGLHEDFFEQLTAERLVTKHPRGMPKREWVKTPSARNEALDCTVYAYAAAVWAGLKRANWGRLRTRVAAPPVESPDGPIKAPGVDSRRGSWVAPRRGFVTGWRA